MSSATTDWDELVEDAIAAFDAGALERLELLLMAAMELAEADDPPSERLARSHHFLAVLRRAQDLPGDSIRHGLCCLSLRDELGVLLSLESVPAYQLLGKLFEEATQWEQAEEAYLEIRTILEAVQAPWIELATCLIALARTQRALGKLDQAVAHLRIAIEIDEQALGLENASLTTSYSELGLLLGEQGQLDEAEGAFRHALHIARCALDCQHPFLARDLARLGQLLLRLNRNKDAALVCTEARDVLRAQGPASDLQRAWVSLDLARACAAEHRWEASASAYRESVVLFKDQPGELPGELAATEGLAEVYGRQGDVGDAKVQAIRVEMLRHLMDERNVDDRR